MKSLVAVLAVCVSTSALAQEAPANYRSISQSRRSYAGGRDDSDLTIQVLPQLKKKTQFDQEPQLDSEGGDFEVMDSSENTEGD